MSKLETLAAPAGGRIGYRVSGTSGDWIVLVHGWCGEAAHWDAILPDLAQDHRVLTVSHPGFGGMEPPPPAGRTVVATASAVAMVVDHLGITDATLIGHSMGGPIATEIAIVRPAKVRAVLGLDTLSDRDYYGRQTAEEIARRRAHFEENFPERMRAMVDNIVHPTTPEALRAEIAAGMAATPAAFALDVKDDLFAWDAEARWPLVSCPAMLLNSPYVARLAHPDPMPCFAKTRITTYDSGHFPMIEAPEALVRSLRGCIALLRQAAEER